MSGKEGKDVVNMILSHEEWLMGFGQILYRVRCLSVPLHLHKCDSRSMRGGKNKSSLHFSAHISGSVQKVSRLKRNRTSDLAYPRQSSFTPNDEYPLQNLVQTLPCLVLLAINDLSILSHPLGIRGCYRFRYLGAVRYPS